MAGGSWGVRVYRQAKLSRRLPTVEGHHNTWIYSSWSETLIGRGGLD